MLHILIIEDDKSTALNLVKGFVEKGFSAKSVRDGETGLKEAHNPHYDVIIVDRMLPKLDGLSIVKALRQDDIDTPILMLTALGEVDNTVEGLSAGADDYMSKPFAFAELVARILTLSKRHKKNNQDTVHMRFGDIKLDKMEREVILGDEKIHLQPREFKLLEYLMENSGETVTRNMLLKHVWSYDFDPQTNVVDVQVSRLRNKLKSDVTTIKSIRGRGYALVLQD